MSLGLLSGFVSLVLIFATMSAVGLMVGRDGHLHLHPHAKHRPS